jgi:Fur family transcriptional regulator, ferric uptake regulator
VLCYNASDLRMNTLRLTKKRQAILDVLKSEHGALSAAELHTKLPQLDLVTIYRNLDLFVKEKLVKRVMLDTSEARFEYQREPHHHALCTDCNKVIHFKALDSAIIKLLGLENFTVEDLEITVRGTCIKK